MWESCIFCLYVYDFLKRVLSIYAFSIFQYLLQAASMGFVLFETQTFYMVNL
jgi:hypothetical protein